MQCIYLQGLHYKETAAKLGISIATVNTLLVNALKNSSGLSRYNPKYHPVFAFIRQKDKNQKHKRLNSIHYNYFSTISKKLSFPFNEN